jgi:vancomycin permeability regulator SanA
MADGKAPARPSPFRRAVVGAAIFNAVVILTGNAYELATGARQTVATPALAPPAPWAIVLGNRVFADGRVSSDLHGRLALALALHRLGKVGKIYVSGEFRSGDAYDEPGVMAAWLRKRGVPDEDLVLDRGGYRTAATMADAVADGLREAIVCTQGYHLPRALFLARQAGLQATGVPAFEESKSAFDLVKVILREGIARPESLLEVALRGVRGHAAPAASPGPKS